MINVTKTFLPPMAEYMGWVQKAFDKCWLTNRGELAELLEEKLKSYLGVDWITLTNNGTVPLQIAVRLLGQGGEIITTPFSFVATTSSIVWQNCTPVFVDIHPEYMTIDERLIESAITDKTSCILATHVFGNPCNVEAIAEIAKKHKLKVIYDAAHCFGVRYRDTSIFNYGDISSCSFHATKIFHTAEGGALFTNDPLLRDPLFYSHNFGQISPVEFYSDGINGKISELQAAMGLSVFPYLGEIISKRKEAVETYDRLLDFSKIQKLKIREQTEWNYSYYPVLFESEKVLTEKTAEMNRFEIFPRRYFYPSLNTIGYINSGPMPVSEDISKRILCLPLSAELKTEEIETICSLLNK